MTRRTAILTDSSSNEFVETLEWKAGETIRLAGSESWFLSKRRMRGGVSDGVDVVTLNNGALSVDVLPTRGMGLWRGTYRGHELGWKSPVKLPVHPSLVDQNDRNGLGWLSGFNEWLCRCGLSAFGPPGIDRVKDASGKVVAEWPLTLHGKIANRPAHKVTVEVDSEGPGTLRVIGEVDETTMFGPCLRLKSTVETEAGSNRLKVTDEVTNLATTSGELMMLYHINVGAPFLEGGSKLVHPARVLAPRDDNAARDLATWDTYLPPTIGYREQCYFIEPAANDDGWSVALLKNAGGNLGMTVRYDTRTLPWFTVWKNTIGERDGYCTGIEPGTGFPNLRTYEREQGRVVALAPGQTYTMRLELGVHDSAEAVATVEEEIDTLQSTMPRAVLESPNPRWTAP
jgi:galactose mutarotase-like enzyme